MGEQKLGVNYNANENEILLEWEGNSPKGCNFLLYRETPNAEGLSIQLMSTNFPQINILTQNKL